MAADLDGTFDMTVPPSQGPKKDNARYKCVAQVTNFQ